MTPSDVHDLIVVLGPTAAGKTRLAGDLCRMLGGEVISADSRQVYRGMDIGTGRILPTTPKSPVTSSISLSRGTIFISSPFSAPSLPPSKRFMRGANSRSSAVAPPRQWVEIFEGLSRPQPGA